MRYRLAEISHQTEKSCYSRNLWYTNGTFYSFKYCFKSLENYDLVEWQLCLTQTVTQKALVPYGRVGRDSLKSSIFWTQSFIMDRMNLDFRPLAISGPRGLGFESRYSDQKYGIRFCGFHIFYGVMGFERPLRKHAGGMFLGRGRILWLLDAPLAGVDRNQIPTILETL